MIARPGTVHGFPVTERPGRWPMSEGPATLGLPQEGEATNATPTAAFLPLESLARAPGRPPPALFGGPPRALPAGRLLMAEGGPAEGLGVVLRGAVRVAATAASGRRATLAVLGPGDVFGESSLVGGGTAAASEVRTLVPTVVAVATEASVRAAAGRPEVAEWLVGALARRAAAAHAALARALTLDVAERLLATLEDLAVRHGRPVPAGTRIEIPLTQDALATLVGATRESVNRALRRLVEGGAIAHRGALYVVRGSG